MKLKEFFIRIWLHEGMGRFFDQAGHALKSTGAYIASGADALLGVLTRREARRQAEANERCEAPAHVQRVSHRSDEPEVEKPCVPNQRAPLRVELVDRI